MPELFARTVTVDRAGPHAGRRPIRALDGVDLRIERGELVAIMGGTGAGKSTLALALAGLVEPTSGDVGGDAVGAVRMVLQRPEATFLAERVLEEVMLAPLARGAPAAAAERVARAQLAQLGIDDERITRDVLALSGGEQRRVAVAAALAAEARVLVLDEPSAGLDRAARQELHDAIRRLHAAGRTVVMVTHDPDEAARLATRLLVLSGGRVVWDGECAPVLADPARADALGLDVAPEVRVLHAVAAARGVAAPTDAATAAGAIDALTSLLRRMPVHDSRGDARARSGEVPDSEAEARSNRIPLPPAIDARPRIVATAIALIAALVSSSLLSAGVVVVATAVVVAAARIDRSRVRLAVRPLLALAAMLVGLQLLVGGAPEVELYHGQPATFGAAPAVHRALQASAIVLATLALSASTATLDLATALRSLMSPLRLLRIPVATLAFVTSTGIGLVPAMADELERLRLAQRARGLRAEGGFVSRLHSDTRLVAPLFVAAFRRAHLLADALAVRDVDPRQPAPPWRAMVVPRIDLVVLAGGVGLVVVARFA